MPNIGRICSRKQSFVLFLVDFFGVVNLFCNKLKHVSGPLFQPAVEAGLITRVTLAGIYAHFEEKAILVAIDKYLLDLLKMAAFFTLFP